MRFNRIAASVGIAGAAVMLSAATASAAPAAKAPAPLIANTSQTLSLSNGNSTPITFTDSTWSLSDFSDAGTFTNAKGKLVLKDTAFPCTFKGKYDASTTLYKGKYTCKMKEGSGTFTVTTDGETDATAAHAYGRSIVR